MIYLKKGDCIITHNDKEYVVLKVINISNNYYILTTNGIYLLPYMIKKKVGFQYNIYDFITS